MTNILDSVQISGTQSERRLAMREFLWPDITPNDIWDRKDKKRTKGFTTIPRGLPLVMSIIDYLSDKGQPCSRPYLVLWCRVYDESFLEIKHPSELAFESGYIGQRAVGTWQLKMQKLQELGFIDAKSGITGDFHYVLLRNPYLIVKALRDSGEYSVPEERYRQLVGRMQEIGAIDLSDAWHIDLSRPESRKKPKAEKERTPMRIRKKSSTSVGRRKSRN